MLPGQIKKPSSSPSGGEKRVKKSNKQDSSAISGISSRNVQLTRSYDDNDDDAEPIWNLPTLQKDQFFAAAYFLSSVQRGQERRARKFNKAYPNPKATDIEKELLDGIALLFARFKPLMDKKDIDEQATSTAQHVTATAMRKTSKGLTVYIAKNDGPQLMDGIDDEKFAGQLSSWFNNESDDSMRQRMHDFWKKRRQYYSQEIPEIWKKAESRSTLQRDLLSHYRKIGINEEKFLADWNDVTSLMASWKSSSSSTDDPDSDRSMEIGRQDYPKFNSRKPDEHLNLANYFRKLVKYIKLHGTVSRVWRTFVRFRHYIKVKAVRFEFLNGQGSFPLDKDSLVTAINSWNSVRGNLEDQVSIFENEKNDVVEKIQKQKTISRYFHCELQLLEKFIAAKDVVDYFGCSKLSCFMCWGILDGSPYRTKDTHAKIYPTCAFPFAMSNGDEHFELALGLKTVQDRLMTKVLRRAVDPDHSLTQYELWSETNPHELLGGMEIDDDRQEFKTANPEPLKLLFQPLPSNFKWIQAIQIPQSGRPRLQLVKLHNDVDDQRYTPHIPIACSKIREERWVSDIEPNIVRDRWFRLFLERPRNDTGIEGWTIGLDIWLFYRLRDDLGNSLSNNEWCLNAVQDVINPIDTQFPWKGDLYLFANVDEGQVDHIPEDILEEDSKAILQSFNFEICRRWNRHSRRRY